MVLQQSQRMPDGPASVASMRTLPFNSSSPWLVMYDTGSPSCFITPAVSAPLAYNPAIIQDDCRCIRLGPCTQCDSICFCGAKRPRGGLGGHRKTAGLAGQEEAFMFVGVALAAGPGHHAHSRSGHVHACRGRRDLLRSARTRAADFLLLRSRLVARRLWLTKLLRFGGLQRAGRRLPGLDSPRNACFTKPFPLYRPEKTFSKGRWFENDPAMIKLTKPKHSAVSQKKLQRLTSGISSRPIQKGCTAVGQPSQHRRSPPSMQMPQ